MAQASEFEKVIEAALSPDNGVRAQAELVFQQGRSSPDQFLSLLVQVLQSSQSLPVRHFSGVMLRQNLKSVDDMWNKCSAATHEGVKQTLLTMLTGEANKTIRKSVTDVIATLARSLLPNHWPELIPQLLAAASSPHSPLRSSAMDLLESLAEFSIEAVKASFDTIKQAICAGLQDSDTGVRISALKAVVAVLCSLEEEGEKECMRDCIPLMFETVLQAANAANDDLLSDAIEQLIGIPRVDATFLRPFLKEVVGLFVPIAGSTTLATTTKRIAMEFLLELGEQGKGMVRKFGPFGASAVPIAFKFLLELQHSADWDDAKEDEDDEENNYLMGLESIERLAFALGGKVFLSIATPIITEFVSSGEWVMRHGGIMAISYLAEACKKALKPQLPALVSLIVPFVGNQQEHPRVRWAAVNALAQLATDFVPYFQTKFHHSVVPALIQALDLNNHQRLVSHAALSFVDFSADAPAETLTPYLDHVLMALLQLLQCNNVKLQESALSAVAAIAIVSEASFEKYYDVFMPGIKQIVISAQGGKDLRELRGKAMECVGLIGKAVGKHKFGPDAVQILDVLFATQNHGLAPDDPTYQYMVTALARICQCLQEDFIPYLAHAIPPLLKSAAIDNACSFSDADDPNAHENDEGFEVIEVAIRSVGNKRITINTALLEEKVTACNMLYQYAAELEAGYFPYVEQTAQLMIPLVRYPFHESVRTASVCTIPALVVSAAAHAKRNNQPNTFVHNLWKAVYKPLMQAIQMETDMDNLHCVLEAFSETIAPLEPSMMTLKQIQEVNLVLVELIKSSHDRRQEREAVRHSPDFDEEESEVLEEENEKEDEFLGYCHLVITKLAQLLGDRYFNFYHADLHSHFLPLLANGKTSGQVNAAVCVVDDIIEYCGTAAKQYVPAFLPIVLQLAQRDEIDLRHSAVFGIGACAKSMGLQFAAAREECLAVLLKVIAAPGSREEDCEPATDNAISAVGKICQYCFEPSQPPLYKNKNLWVRWLSWLPLKGDEEEAMAVHDRLADMVLSQNVHVLGEQNRMLPAILKVFAAIVGGPCIKDETAAKVKQIWSTVAQTMPGVVSALESGDVERLQTL